MYASTYLLLYCLIWAMGGGARAAVSLSISAVRVEVGHADFPLHTQSSFITSRAEQKPRDHVLKNKTDKKNKRNPLYTAQAQNTPKSES